MLTNECHECQNYIEFPDFGVGEEIRCPHCGLAVVLTSSEKTAPPPPANSQAPLDATDASPPPGALARGENLAHALGLDAPESVAAQLAGRRRRTERTVVINRATLVTGVAVAMAVVALLLVVGLRRGGSMDAPTEHREEMNRFEAEAQAAHAPTGLFGTKWLMSMSEVMKVAPGAKKVDPAILSDKKTFYNRPAEITYHFATDGLLLITITFTGNSTPADFEQTQARLSADYGKMPPPSKAEGFALSSVKKLGHFFVQHGLSPNGPASVEQVLFYVGKGGNPKNMPKVKTGTSAMRPSRRPLQSASSSLGSAGIPAGESHPMRRQECQRSPRTVQPPSIRA